MSIFICIVNIDSNLWRSNCLYFFYNIINDDIQAHNNLNQKIYIYKQEMDLYICWYKCLSLFHNTDYNSLYILHHKFNMEFTID